MTFGDYGMISTFRHNTLNFFKVVKLQYSTKIRIQTLIQSKNKK